MSEVTHTTPDRLEQDEMQDRGHGDKLEDVVERVVESEGAEAKKDDRLKGDEVME